MKIIEKSVEKKNMSITWFWWSSVWFHAWKGNNWCLILSTKEKVARRTSSERQKNEQVFCWLETGIWQSAKKIDEMGY